MPPREPTPLVIGDDDMVGVCIMLPRTMRAWLRYQAGRSTDEERRRVTQAEVVRRLIDADPCYAVWLQEQARPASRRRG